MKEWLNINELAEQTNIPDTTIRRYISKFSTFFIHKGGARSRRYEDKAVKVLIRIKQLYDEGHESEEVDNVLRREFAVVIDGDKGEELFEKSSTPALATAEDMAEIKEALKQQQEFNKLLIEKLAEQERYIKEVLENQDQLLLESVKVIQEQKSLLESATTTEKVSFFKKLFMKNN